ncbi:glycoside hydrolase family 125 protein [Sinomonas halotolerans]|uniref:Glycoside hydrolase family 125 protein n=1 Tax=Sinomonas halotolerans TaxID=1644133 RepID=A0ABU9WY14_9MICC
MTPRKPRDVGNGLLAASFTAKEVLAVVRPHPHLGMVELTGAREFAEGTDRGVEARVRDYRRHLADASSAALVLESDAEVELKADTAAPSPGLTWTARSEGPLTVRFRGRLQRPPYAEITEIAPPEFLAQDTVLEADGPVLTLRSAGLGAVATVRASSPSGAVAWVRTGEGAECRAEGAAAQLSLTVEFTVDGGVPAPRGRAHLVAPSPGSLAARTHAAAVQYALGCCALDVADGMTCVVTDHRLLPLSWTRDAYFVVLPLLLQGEPGSEEEDVLRRHLNWLFGPARADGPWMRSHLTGGQVKDPGLQADQQLYPVLELVDFRRRFGHWPSPDLGHWRAGIEAAFADLVADPATGLLVSEETPADDPAEYPHNFSTQVLYAEVLTRLSTVADEMGLDGAELAQRAQQVRKRTKELFLVDGPAGPAYAYETDGTGQYRLYADANDLPAPLAAAWGFCAADDPAWRSTMETAFNPDGPFTVAGRLGGLGSVHTAGVWALGLVQELLYARTIGDSSRQERVLATLGELVSEDGMLPETADPETGAWLSRDWFGWPGAALAAVLASEDLRPQPAR